MKSILAIPFALSLLIIPQDFPKGNIAEKPKTLAVVNTGGEMYQKWQVSVEKKCSLETSVLVLAMFEAQQAQGNQMTQEDVNRLKNMLMFSCSKYHNIAF